MLEGLLDYKVALSTALLGVVTVILEHFGGALPSTF